MGDLGPALGWAVAAGTTITLLTLLTCWWGVDAILTSWASSAALIASAPRSRAARPVAVVGGHCLAALVGVAMVSVSGGHYWPVGISVAAAFATLYLLDVMHPPAVANAAIVYALQEPAPSFIGRVAVGAAALALGALLARQVSR